MAGAASGRGVVLPSDPPPQGQCISGCSNTSALRSAGSEEAEEAEEFMRRMSKMEWDSETDSNENCENDSGTESVGSEQAEPRKKNNRMIHRNMIQDARTSSNDENIFVVTNCIDIYRILTIFMPICSP